MIAGVFITLEEKDGTAEMRKVANAAGQFKHPHSTRKYPRLQHWHFRRADLRAREETMFPGWPDLPEIMGPNEKKVELRQSDFDYWKPSEEEN